LKKLGETAESPADGAAVGDSRQKTRSRAERIGRCRQRRRSHWPPLVVKLADDGAAVVEKDDAAAAGIAGGAPLFVN